MRRLVSSKVHYMVLSTTIQSALLRHQQRIDAALHQALRDVYDEAAQMFYGQMQYHLGWVDTQFAPTHNNPGKLLRPTLLLLAYEAAGAWGLTASATASSDYLRRALPAAAAVELTHNFTLIHDDIEDSDEERRHRTTLWRQWGIPQAINTGDGLFALSRLSLWKVLDEGVEGTIAARLGAALDRACLILAEGQYLDISFEQRLDISVAMYIDMIGRKTAALMGCATEMGAMLGTRDQNVIESLRNFGWAIGVAFQVRDDLLGVWASMEMLGKTQSGDIYRRKKSLPILYALEHASESDKHFLQSVYQQKDTLTDEQVRNVLAVFERTHTRDYCHEFLMQQCQSAYQALAQVPQQGNSIAERALHDMNMIVRFVEEVL
ncbi:MAG TPA: polyprenyl synthetase [Ktedonobacter sp.]|nr:polyprenyl synthetase [Ktedonobacter sp.]